MKDLLKREKDQGQETEDGRPKTEENKGRPGTDDRRPKTEENKERPLTRN